MRIIIALVVYFIMVNAGDSILERLGWGIGDAYGVSYFSGSMNFSVSGAVTSFILAIIGATVLKMIDEEQVAFVIACLYWIYQIYSDFGDRSEIGMIGFLLITMENIIMLAGLILVNCVIGYIKDHAGKIRSSSDVSNLEPPVEEDFTKH